jgi:hypothetical protein
MKIFKYLEFNKLEKIQIPDHSICNSCLNIKPSSVQDFSYPIQLNNGCDCKNYLKLIAHVSEFILRNCYGGIVHKYEYNKKNYYWCRIYSANNFSSKSIVFSEYGLSEEQLEQVFEFYWNCDFRPPSISKINREIENNSLAVILKRLTD